LLSEFIKAFLLIFIAEIGDKTQILALAYATKYNGLKVLTGVFIGVLLNHAIAVIAGVFLSSMIPLNYVRIVAAFAFIIFGLWSLKNDGNENEEEKKYSYGAIMTVAITFFVGELGDKTQLTALTLSSTSKYPIAILMGTVTGMLVISGIGIIVGIVLGKKIPQSFIKYISGFVFIIFGVISLMNSVPERFINPVNLFLFIGILFILVLLIIRRKKR
jgi:putative Ca2+/H+ antiporter (TMEM165/GDT1 family)